MKKIVFVIVCCFAFFSCKRDKKDDLEGKWQLKEVVDLSSGTTNTVDTVWYNIQNTVFMYQLYDESNGTGLYRQCHGFKTWEDKQTVLFELADPDPEVFITYTDWVSTSRSFVVEKASGSQLILSSEGKRYLFKKF